MPPQLGYKKSRTGCLRCKQRRVKCDEKRPCSACARHGLSCSLTERASSSQSTNSKDSTSEPRGREDRRRLASRRPRSPTQASSRNSTGSSIALGPVPIQTYLADPFPYFAKFVTDQEPVEKSTWITDLELMHHYTSSAYKHLPRAQDLQQVWQVEVPRMALSHIFLLHQVLAISAHHLAYLNPDRRSFYAVYASKHQNHAVASLRAALARIDESTCQAIFLTSSLLSISAFATFSDNGRASEHPRLNDLLDIFQLIRGMSNILNSWKHIIEAGHLADLFQGQTVGSPALLLTETVEQLRQLSIPDDFDPSVVALCRETVSDLGAWIDMTVSSTKVPELRFTMSGPICLSDHFIDLIRQRHPIPLAIIAYYCLTMEMAGADYWFVRGWGKHVMNDITDSIDGRWRELVSWPLAAIERCNG